MSTEQPPKESGWYAAAIRRGSGAYLLHVYVLFVPAGATPCGPSEAQVLIPGEDGFVAPSRVEAWGPMVKAPRVVIEIGAQQAEREREQGTR